MLSPLHKSLTFVVATATGFGIAGGLVGALIGRFAPDYYRTYFDSGANLDFSALQVGIGLGVTQGLAVGVAVATALVLASVIGRSRETGPANEALWVVLGTTIIFLIGTAAFLMGGISGQGRLYARATAEKIEVIERVLSANHAVGLTVDSGSGGRVSLSGTVASEGVKQSLQQALAVEFGMSEARKLVSMVDVFP